MDKTPNINQLSEEQLRALAARLLVDVQQKDKTTHIVTTENQKLKHEMAILKRHKFARTSEALNNVQRSLLDDLVDENIAAIEE